MDHITHARMKMHLVTFYHRTCSFDRLTVCCIIFDLKILKIYLIYEYELVAFYVLV